MGVELYGKTLGLIGAGNIGSIVADRAIGLKMKVVAYDPFLSPERAVELGVEKVELDDLLRARRLHHPAHAAHRQDPQHHRPRRSRRPRRACSSSTAPAAAWSTSGRCAPPWRRATSAARRFDVFEAEPAKENPLFGAPNVICTPHLGASTNEAQENVALQVAEQMSDYLLTGAVTNALNIPSVTAEEAPRLKPFVALADKLGAVRRPDGRVQHQGRRLAYRGRGRPPQHQAADRRGAGRRDAADAGGRQHGLGRRPSPRSAASRLERRRAARTAPLREPDPHHRHHRQVRALLRRHGVLRRPPAHHPGARHRHGVRACAAHALRQQPRQAGLHRHASAC